MRSAVGSLLVCGEERNSRISSAIDEAQMRRELGKKNRKPEKRFAADELCVEL